MQRTYRCPCSVRVLEAIVRDFTGLELRQRSSNLGIRLLSTRPALAIRSSASQSHVTQSHTPARNLDDTFVPFDFNSENNKLGRIQDLSIDKPASPLSSHVSPLPLELGDVEGVKDLEDFEPELVIHQDGDAQLQATSTADSCLVLDTTPAFQTIDAIAFPDLQTQSLITQDATDTQRLDMMVIEKSKVERRKERKLRRLEAKKQDLEEVKAQEEAAQAAVKRQARKERRKAKALLNEQETSATTTASPPIKAATTTISPPTTIKTKAASNPKTQRFTPKLPEEPITPKYPRKEKESWQIQKAALESKFGTQTWNPRKRISPDALAGIRALHAKSPETYNTPVLSEYFKVPPEAIRRILKSKWEPKEEEVEERRRRWEKRGQRKWEEMAAEGIRPPKRWRDMGVGKVDKGEVPLWKRAGVKGERWVQESSAENFVIAGDMVKEDVDVDVESDFGDGIVDRIL